MVSVTASLDIKHFHLCIKHARACALAAIALTCVAKLKSEHTCTPRSFVTQAGCTLLLPMLKQSVLFDLPIDIIEHF